MMYRPVLVSEREAAHVWPDGQPDDAHWEDCAWTSALMLANATTGGKFPPTLAEAEAARALVMGPSGGTTITQLVTGSVARWKLNASRLNADAITFDAFWAALTPGKGAVAMGKLAGLPYGHRLRRWQPDYAGGHAVYVQREAAEDRVWWMDPLSTTGYPGEYALKGELAAYYNAFRVYGAGALVAPVYAPSEADVNPKFDMPVAVADVSAGTPVIDATTGATLLPSWNGGANIGLYSRGGGNAAIRIDLGAGGSDLHVAYVRDDHISNVRLPGAQPPTGSAGQAELDAATAKGFAEAKAKALTAVGGITNA